MKKALFIYNPNAGKGLLKPKLSDIIDIIVKAGYEVVVYPTQKYKDAYYKVKTFTEEYDRVICSGGDGTLEVTLIRTPKNPLALQEIIGALLSSQINTKHIYSFKTGEIHFESVEEIPWTLDGEFGGEHDSVCIKNAKQALKIVVPEEEQ